MIAQRTMRQRTLSQCRGMNLLELVAASVLGLVILLAIGEVDVARVRLYEENLKIARRTTDPSRGESEAGWLLQRLMADARQADRVVLRDMRTLTDAEGNPVLDEAGNPKKVSNRLQLRIPDRETATTVADLRNPANYDWMEYRLDPQHDVGPRHERVLVYRDIATYDNQGNRVSSECEGFDDDFRDVTNFQLRYLDIARPALGGDPLPEGKDNNVLELIISSIENIKFGATTVPAIAYANVNAACLADLQTGEEYCDSGSGLARPTEPPCP